MSAPDHFCDEPRADRTRHKGLCYGAPDDLRRTRVSGPVRALVVGSCLSEAVAGRMNTEFGMTVEHELFNQVANLSERSNEDLRQFDFQFLQLPLRSVTPEHHWLVADLDDPQSAAAYFELCRERLEQMLDSALAYNKQADLLTFVSNFMVPQKNYLGRFLPRYDLRNPVFFVEELNRALYNLIMRYKHCHMVDLDQISAIFGRKYAQDDAVWALSHGGLIGEFDYWHDLDRIVPPGSIRDYYDIRSDDLADALIAELDAMYRTARRTDAVKMVVIDLDDTLWRGVFAEGAVGTLEGWPLGFIEALLFLKRRGVILAIVSKNDETLIRENWNERVYGLLPIESFAAVRINWRPKAENIAEIIAEVNLLPNSVVFIDDNPAERASVKAAFPDIRVLGADLYYLRRVLLWSPELQTVNITGESARRTEMIQAQAIREVERTRMSRDEFLASLSIEVTLTRLSGKADDRAPRAFELLNKTNQFNTTGTRWTEVEWSEHFTTGGQAYAFDVKDRFSQYGLTAVVVVKRAAILQFVMSCRVIGLNVEVRALDLVCEDLRRQGYDDVTGLIAETDRNLLSRDLYARCGFHRDDGHWTRSLHQPLEAACPP